MKKRILTVAVLIGVAIVGVTFLGAARMSGDDAKSSKDSSKVLGQVKAGSKGVVVFGNIDVDNGVGLIPLYPETFPQPSKIIAPKSGERLPVDGEGVKKGQVLARLNSTLTDFAVAEAKAGLDQANAAKERADGLLAQADQALQAHQVLINTTQFTLEGKDIELKNAIKDLEDAKTRAARIGAQGDPELRTAQGKIDAARKALDAEQAKLEGLKRIQPTSKKKEAEGALAEANAAIVRQQAVLDKAKYAQTLNAITAPSDGKIVRSMVAEGMAFGPQTRQPAFLFQPNGPLVVRAEVDQEFASRVSVGQEAVITDDGNPNIRWTGKVIRVADSFLPKRSSAGVPEGLSLNETRVLECVVTIEGVEPNAPIRVGQRVKVAIGVE